MTPIGKDKATVSWCERAIIAYPALRELATTAIRVLFTIIMRKRKDRAAEIAARLPRLVVRLTDGSTFYTVEGLAGLLGVQRITVWRWLKAGRLTGARVGRQVYISEATVREFLESGGVNGKKESRGAK